MRVAWSTTSPSLYTYVHAVVLKYSCALGMAKHVLQVKLLFFYFLTTNKSSTASFQEGNHQSLSVRDRAICPAVPISRFMVHCCVPGSIRVEELYFDNPGYILLSRVNRHSSS
jgi:hypothetical protein